MTQRIIFQNEDKSVGVIIPTAEVLTLYTIEEVAKKDVPSGLPYKIVDVSEIPTDRTYRGQWELEADTVFDGVGGDSNEFEVAK